MPCLYATKTGTAIPWATYIRYDIDILNDGNGAHSDKWITACSYSAIQYSWLACYQSKVSLAKEARIDPNDPLVVWYRLEVTNNANYPVIAKVSGYLPEGMSLPQLILADRERSLLFELGNILDKTWPD